MNSKNLLQQSLNHKQSDKIPIDFGSTAVTGMHITCVEALRNYYGLEKKPIKVSDPYQMLGEIDKDLMESIGIDVVPINPRNNMFGFASVDWKEWTMDNGLKVLVPGKFNVTKDNIGTTFIYPEGDLNTKPSAKMPKGGYYFDTIIRQHEIDEDALNPEDNLEEFKPLSDLDIEYYKREGEKAVVMGKGIVANVGGTGLGDVALVPGPFLKDPKGIRDIEEWYISTVARQDYVHSIFEKQTDIAIKNFGILNKEIGSIIDVMYICGTDFGTQIGTFCSPTTFNELYKPYYKKMNDWIHKNTNWKTFKHSCGAIETFITLLIESGFDIINPVQCSAVGMEPENLKMKYGKDIVFWGGGIDTQRILPFGTPKEVREQVLRRCEIFSKDGGFVFDAIHNVQANTPVNNIVAMIDAVKEFNR